ncbi:hypothetical protein [Vescimonas sp.]
MEHIIRASKAPLRLVCAGQLPGPEIPHRPQEVSEDVFGSGEEEHQLFRKLPYA